MRFSDDFERAPEDVECALIVRASGVRRMCLAMLTAVPDGPDVSRITWCSTWDGTPLSGDWERLAWAVVTMPDEAADLGVVI